MNKKNDTYENNKPNIASHSTGNVIYLVIVCSGQYEDYRERPVFATKDKELAKKWRDRFNRIIDSNEDRMNHYYDDGDYDKVEPFWYDEIRWRSPQAQVREVELR